jgi:large repetitive protein
MIFHKSIKAVKSVLIIFFIASGIPCFGQGHVNVNFNSNKSGCEPFTAAFTSSLSYPDSNNKPKIVEYDWDFGDGTAHSSDKNPEHIFRTNNQKFEQYFTVSLKVTATTGYTFDTVKQNWIRVIASPHPVIISKPNEVTIANPLIQFDVDTILSHGIRFNDTATKYYWTLGDFHNPGCTSAYKSPVYSYSDTGKYKVKVLVKSNGCIGWDSVSIKITPQLLIFIPNIFKPGGKHGNKSAYNYFAPGINETFQPVVIDYTSFEMAIFSSSGELYFETTDPNIGWHGDIDGKPAQEGVYYYVVKVKNLQGKEFRYTGSITLIR